MSTMGCKGGGVISDVITPRPTPGLIFGDQDHDRLHRALPAQVADFLAAVRDGRRREWLEQRCGPGYPQELSDAEVISDILTWSQNPYVLSIAECERCGRLHVQTAPGRNEYRTFVPDEPGYHRALARKSTDASP